MLYGLGLHEISDEEYLARMNKTRDAYMKRIHKLEQQIDEERKGDSRESENN
jgi:hypothetical protein